MTDYDSQKLPEIEKTLEEIGYVRLQFSTEYLPKYGSHFMEEMEKFFIEMIEKLGGQCSNHNGDENSIVWHVQPKEKTGYLARSETDEEFPFHTDCSYELNPPEYMALFVLEEDQFDGGHLEIIHLTDVLELLSEETKGKFLHKQFRIEVPLEFRKSSDIDHIDGPILLDEERIRFRSDILSEDNAKEMKELNAVLSQVRKYRPELTQYTMILLNNQKYLHGRTQIFDRRRHLLRIRFDRPYLYNIFTVYEREKLRPEYLTFSKTFYTYLNEQHQDLYQVFNRIVKEYDQPTNLGEEIRQTFRFDSKTHYILTQLNSHRPDFRVGTFRPDILFAQGNRFRINGKYSFEPKFCEINARFPFNGFLLSARLCSSDKQNKLSKKYSTLVGSIIKSSNFDTTKAMFILKGKEDGFDIHLFREYWMKKYSQPCLFVDPKQLQIQNGKLIDRISNSSVEQFILELHQEEILDLPDDILELFLTSSHLNYINDFRTIFLLHDKRLFSLLSNKSFLYALMNSEHQTLTQSIPLTHVIEKLPNYLKDSILRNRSHWCIKPNSAGKGEDVTLGVVVTQDQWSSQLLHPDHQQWIVQQFHESIQYQSMNLSGMLICSNDQCFNTGVIRMSRKDIVNISHGGYYIRPYIHQERIHCMADESILTKEKLHEQLIRWKSLDQQWNRSVYVSSSGGSGGKSLYFLTDIQENQLQRNVVAQMMIDVDVISENDICLNLFQSNNIYRSFEIFNDLCSIANSTSIPMGADAEDQKILDIIEYFQPNILMGSPYRLMKLALFIEQKKHKAVVFEKIYFACEALDERKEKYLKRIFHCSIFLGFYGSAEVGVFACQSPKYSSTKRYLYPKDSVQIEIVDSKIIVTNLIRKRNQLKRFDTGDLGQLISDDDNDKYGLLEVFQSQRLIFIGSDELSNANIEETMKQVKLVEWQLIVDYVSETNNKQIRLLFLYVKSDETNEESLEKDLRNYLQKFFHVPLEELSEQLTLQFQSIKFDELITNPTSNKLLKTIDRRS